MNTQQNPTINAHLSVEFVKEAMGHSPKYGIRVSNAEAEALIQIITDRWGGLPWSVVFLGTDDEAPLCSSEEWLRILAAAVEAGAKASPKIPVLAVGTDDYMTLVFLTAPHDERGHYAVGWDRMSGHGAVGLGWARRQPQPSRYFADNELTEYCERHELDPGQYELVTKITREHTFLRRKVANECRMRAHAG